MCMQAILLGSASNCIDVALPVPGSVDPDHPLAFLVANEGKRQLTWFNAPPEY